MGRLARFIRFYTEEDDGGEGGRGVPTKISGVSPLVLLNSVKGKIKSLLQHGKVTVDGSDVTCNNGTLSVVNGEIVTTGTPEEIRVTGVNQWDEEWELGTYNYQAGIKIDGTANIRSTNYIPVKENTNYYFKSSIAGGLPRIIYYNSQKEYLSYKLGSTPSLEFTTPENCAYMTFYMSQNYGTTYNNDISINYPAIVTDYHPYAEPQTATAVNLYACDGIEDTQDIITGEVIRRNNVIVYDGTQEVGSRYVGVKENGNIIIYPKEAEYTGDIVSFTTDKEREVNVLEASMQPVQDLHGQDAPYPAGGGVNKFDGTTWNTYIPLHLNVGDKIVAQCNVDEDHTSAYFIVRTYDSNKTFLQSFTNNQGTTTRYNKITITSEAEYIQVQTSTQEYFSNTIIAIGDYTLPMTYSPYSNICPITGWTGCEVTRTGKNLISGVLDNTLLDGSGKLFTFANFKTIYAPICPNTTYTFAQSVVGNYKRYALCNALESGTSIYNPLSQTTAGYNSTNPLTFTNTDFKYFVATIYNTNDSKTFDEIFDSCQLEVGSYSTEPEEYQGTTLSVTFPDGQTVYGGTVDFVSGNGNETGFLDVFNEENTDGRLMSSIFIEPSGAVATVLGDTIRLGFNKRETFPNVNFSSNTYPKYVSNLLKHYFAFNSDTPHWYINGQCYLFLPVSLAGTTQESAIAYLKGLITAGTPLSIWIPYVEPVPFAVTPQPISTLAGENNIWTDTNGTTFVAVADDPVIEHATPQPLRTVEGTTVITVEAEVDDIQFDVEYKAEAESGS